MDPHVDPDAAAPALPGRLFSGIPLVREERDVPQRREHGAGKALAVRQTLARSSSSTTSSSPSIHSLAQDLHDGFSVAQVPVPTPRSRATAAREGDPLRDEATSATARPRRQQLRPRRRRHGQQLQVQQQRIDGDNYVGGPDEYGDDNSASDSGSARSYSESLSRGRLVRAEWASIRSTAGGSPSSPGGAKPAWRQSQKAPQRPRPEVLGDRVRPPFEPHESDRESSSSASLAVTSLSDGAVERDAVRSGSKRRTRASTVVLLDAKHADASERGDEGIERPAEEQQQQEEEQQMRGQDAITDLQSLASHRGSDSKNAKSPANTPRGGGGGGGKSHIGGGRHHDDGRLGAHREPAPSGSMVVARPRQRRDTAAPSTEVRLARASSSVFSGGGGGGGGLGSGAGGSFTGRRRSSVASKLSFVNPFARGGAAASAIGTLASLDDDYDRGAAAGAAATTGDAVVQRAQPVDSPVRRTLSRQHPTRSENSKASSGGSGSENEETVEKPLRSGANVNPLSRRADAAALALPARRGRQWTPKAFDLPSMELALPALSPLGAPPSGQARFELGDALPPRARRSSALFGGAGGCTPPSARRTSRRSSAASTGSADETQSLAAATAGSTTPGTPAAAYHGRPRAPIARRPGRDGGGAGDDGGEGGAGRSCGSTSNNDKEDNEEDEDENAWFGHEANVECRRASNRAFVRATRRSSMFFGAAAHDLEVPDASRGGSHPLQQSFLRRRRSASRGSPGRPHQHRPSLQMMMMGRDEPQTDLGEELCNTSNDGFQSNTGLRSFGGEFGDVSLTSVGNTRMKRSMTTFGSTSLVDAPCGTRKRVSYARVDQLRMDAESRRGSASQRRRGSLTPQRRASHSLASVVSRPFARRTSVGSGRGSACPSDDDGAVATNDAGVHLGGGGVFTRSRRRAVFIPSSTGGAAGPPEDGDSGGGARNSQRALGQRHSQRVLEDPFASSEERQLHQAALARVPLEFVVADLQRRVSEHEVVHDVFYFIPFLIMFTIYFLLGRDIEQNHLVAAAIRDADVRGEDLYAASQAKTMLELMRGAPRFFHANQTIDITRSTEGSTRSAVRLGPNVGLDGPLDFAAIAADAPLRAEPPFLNISAHAHWLRWMHDVFIPTTWDCENPDHREKEVLRRRGSTPMLGAARVRVLRVGEGSCSLRDVMRPERVRALEERRRVGDEDEGAAAESDLLSDEEQQYLAGRTRCFPPFERDLVDEEPFCSAPNPAKPEENLFAFHRCRNFALSNRGEMRAYPCAGYIATLPFSAACNQVRAFVRLITPRDELLRPESEHRGIDAALRFIPSIENNRTACAAFTMHASVRMIMLEYFAYSVSNDALVRVKAIVEVTAGGALLPNYTTRVFALWTINDLASTVFEFIFFAFILYFFRKMLSDWALSYRKTGKYTAFVMDIWNLMEACNLTTMVVSLAFRWAWWLRSRNYVIPSLEDAQYPEELDDIEYFFTTQIHVNAVNVVLTFLKILKYMRLNDRLNVLTRTLESCQSDILALLILFVFLHTGFAFCGMMLYGVSIGDYKNLNTSFSTLMFNVLGSFDYGAMSATQPELTPLFFFVYTFLGRMLFLNFFIVVLSIGFAQVNRQTTLLPIDVAVLRLLDEVRLWMRWDYLREWLFSKTLSRSRISLMVDMTAYLREHLELTSAAALDLHVKEDAYMSFRDLEWWLPRSIVEGLGENFLLTTWEDLVFEYHNKLKTSIAAVERERFTSSVRTGLEKFMVTAVPDFVTLELQSESLEVRLEALPRLLCRCDGAPGHLLRQTAVRHQRGGGGLVVSGANIVARGGGEPSGYSRVVKKEAEKEDEKWGGIGGSVEESEDKRRARFAHLDAISQVRPARGDLQNSPPLPVAASAATTPPLASSLLRAGGGTAFEGEAFRGGLARIVVDETQSAVLSTPSETFLSVEVSTRSVLGAGGAGDGGGGGGTAGSQGAEQLSAQHRPRRARGRLGRRRSSASRPAASSRSEGPLEYGDRDVDESVMHPDHASSFDANFRFGDN